MIRWLPALLFVLLSARVTAPAQAADPGVQTTWRLLDYIAVDYREAIADGRVVNQFEYEEMTEFSKSVAANVAALPESAAKTNLAGAAAELQRVIAAKAPPADVAARARAL
ncbi:MAG TPA: iron permease, partial [Allosphingosinicella sp.]|nr:iron permease [Allosphingosinicella sp.]